MRVQREVGSRRSGEGVGRIVLGLKRAKRDGG